MNTLYADTTGKLLAEYREVSEELLLRTAPYAKKADRVENVGQVIALLWRQSQLLYQLLGITASYERT